MGEWAFCPIEAEGKPTPDKVGTAELKESEPMRKIRKIDFKRLWACINSNVNNNAWRDAEFHPVPVIYWDEALGMNRRGWIKLPIQLHPPKKGGVCRFTVAIPVGLAPIRLAGRSVSLAKYLQTNHHKNRLTLIHSNLFNCLVSCYCDEMQVPEDMMPEEDRDMLKRQADRYTKAIGE